MALYFNVTRVARAASRGIRVPTVHNYICILCLQAYLAAALSSYILFCLYPLYAIYPIYFQNIALIMCVYIFIKWYMFHPQQSHITSNAQANTKLLKKTRHELLIIYTYINSLGSKIITSNPK